MTSKTPPAETKSSRALVASRVFAGIGVVIGIAALTTSIPLTGGAWFFASSVPVFAVSICFAARALRTRKFDGIGVTVAPLLLGSLGFGPGTLMLVNSIGAGNELRIVTVISRTDIGREKAFTRAQKSYQVWLAPFPPLDEPLHLYVSESVYEDCAQKLNQTGVLRVAPGNLGFPFVVAWRGFPELECRK
jgi:hypothetical protein